MPVMVDDRPSDVAFADDEVEHARRRARLDQNLRRARGRSPVSASPASARPCCRRRGQGALFHAGIAIGKFHGVISPKTPTGFAIGLDVDRGPRGLQRLPVAAQRLAGEIFEDSRGAHDLAGALGERLALLAGQQGAEFLRAAMTSDPALSSTSERTSGEASDQAGNAARAALTASLTSRGAALGIARDDIVEVRRIDAFAGARRRRPLRR